VIQGDINKGEEGLSFRDQVQRKKVQSCNKRRKLNSKKSKDKFLGSQQENLADLKTSKQI
jgi:hypothetical protein